jgi:hypothetical protein
MTASLPNNDSDLDEEEKILDDLNLAIISACTNIQNCLKRKDFTNQSPENFKQNRAESYELLKKLLNHNLDQNLQNRQNHQNKESI